MGQYNFSITGRITDRNGEIIGHIVKGGKLILSDESLAKAVFQDLRSQIASDDFFRVNEKLLMAEKLPPHETTGKIRLACIECETEEADWVDEIPAGWEVLTYVQSFEDSLVEGKHNRRISSALEWYTHLGLCPQCREQDDE